MAQVYFHDISDQSREIEAAKDLTKQLEDALDAYRGRIWVIPSVDIHPGTGRHDVDLLVMGYLENYYVDEIAGKSNIQIRNFFTCIELKSHDVPGIKPRGTRMFVGYGDDTSDVTKQSEAQKESLKRFLKGPLKQENMRVPFVTNLIWLTGITRNDLESNFPVFTEGNILTSDLTVDDLFCAIGRQSYLVDGGFVKAFDNSCTKDDIDFVADIFCAKSDGVDCMTLRKMNILKRGIPTDDIVAKLMSGDPLIVLSGHAGTGKTVMLLKAANHLCQLGKKCLFLTYNTALIADLKHTMNILYPKRHSLEMQSMHSFLIGLMTKAGIWKHGLYDVSRDFDHAVATLHPVMQNHQITVDYEYIFVDEAQDWRQKEADILRHYSGNSHIVIADGVDQFMYSDEHTEWGRSPFPKLKTSLRQRANLVSFAKIFASKFGVYWDVKPSRDIPGGRIIVTNDYNPTLHDDLRKDAQEHGCTAYDFMLLAPLSLVQDGKFKLLDVYKVHNINLYDGIDKANRQRIYSSVNHQNDECRVYTYESCRGLEAWTTVCLKFDELFEASHPHSYDGIPYKAARDYMLALWALIPLTRAVDTLVLGTKKGSYVDTLLREIEAEHPDLIIFK